MTKHTVIAILEIKPGMEAEIEAALSDVAAASRAEDSNVEYRLHKSIENPQQFILYENWVSKEKHAEQFEKPYIHELVKKLENALAKPYQVYMARELEA